MRPVAITTLALPNGVTNEVYSATLTAAGGTSPYAWSLTDGSLPPGLTLADGAIERDTDYDGDFQFCGGGERRRHAGLEREQLL